MRRLRVAVPVTCVTLVVVIALLSWFQPLRMLRALPGQLGNVVISGTKIKMEAPRLAGYTRDARAYEFTARSAAQDLTKPDLVELQDIAAKMALPDGQPMTLNAREGIYDSKADLLKLANEILVVTPSYQGRLQEAVIEMRAGTVVSNRPVEVKMLQGLLNANRMEVTESGAITRFSGGVDVQFRGGALQGEPVAAEAR